jgi:hypothetical protein
MGKKSRSGSGTIPDHIFESLETILWVKILKFFDADTDSGSGIFLTLDPGWEIFGSGLNIPDPEQHCCYGGRGGHHSKNAAEHTSMASGHAIGHSSRHIPGFLLLFNTFSLAAGLLHDSHACWHREAQEEGIPVLRSAHYSERQGLLGRAGG